MLQFCSITSSSHLFKSFALADSLKTYGYNLNLLIVDDFELKNKPDNVTILRLSDLEKNENTLKIINRYKNKFDKLRWALKPVLILQLLKSFRKVVYVDNDIYFYNSPKLIEQLLEKNSVVLTPHFYSFNPQIKQNWFEANFRVGLYNAGFIAVQQEGKKAIEWWLLCCLYNLKKSYKRGLFDDQKYLDLLPVAFENIYILKHKGYNVAGWNTSNYTINNNENKVLINNTDELVFIHFAKLSLQLFSFNDNPLHTQYLTYIKHLNQYKKFRFNKYANIRLFEVLELLNYAKWKMLRLFE